MFDTTWKNPRLFLAEGKVEGAPTRLPIEKVESVAFLHWQEHCQECAPPTCYRNCMKYIRRIDGKCRRMEYGFAEDRSFSGLFPFGIDCRYEPWAQIECKFNPLAYTPEAIRRLDRFSRGLSRGMLSLSKAVRPFTPKMRPSWALDVFRERFFRWRGKGAAPRFDAFVFECHSAEDRPFRLNLQVDHNRVVMFRHAFDIVPGHNYFELPFGSFNISPMVPNPRIVLYPEDELRCRLIITWLDFVRFVPMPAGEARPADKVKCVAWDLDNTLWKGVLIEDGPEKVRLNREAVEVIKLLDRRGIIHTVVSKNTHREAVALLEKLGLADYFIYPAINWGAKSESLKQVASRINIGLDAFAFVDDSPHEREEVSSRLPMVRAYDEKQVAALPALPEFDVPETEMSRERRLSYLAEMKREEIQASFGDNYEDFLRGLGMRMEIFRPTHENEKTRCIELLQRSNQLNISTHRYTPEEFAALLASKEMQCYGFRCSDKFGDFGIVGFMSIAMESAPRIQDLVISCRIAQKRFEHALIYWLSRRLKKDGHKELLARLKKTKRNGPLVEVFKGLPFDVVEEDGQTILYRLPDLGMVRDANIISTTFRERG